MSNSYSGFNSNRRHRRNRGGFMSGRANNLFVGFVFILIGTVLLLRALGVVLPEFIFKWEMILILVGIGIGIKSGFRDFGWLAVTAVGLFFLADDFFPDLNTRRFIFPVAILGVGAFIVLKRLSPSNNSDKMPEPYDDPNVGPIDATNQIGQATQITPASTGSNTSDGFQSGFKRMDEEPFIKSTTETAVPLPAETKTADPAYSQAMLHPEEIDIAAVFGAVNRKIFSKNFKGGEAVCVFGGSEIDMMNADITEGPIELEIVCILGGATLFIPPNWYVKTNMSSVFGGVDDRRKNINPDPSKMILIKGVCIFGGMEIKTRY
ncbi:MAG: hypothetical protein EOO02_09505 [Chitinophagaceae bacterium]|nr:MAG: hypothetical protein EOO02_09505 [Chitinophagaceae bacterium]